MEPLNWTGALGTVINPIFGLAVAVAAALIIARFILGFFASAGTASIQMDASTGCYRSGLH